MAKKLTVKFEGPGTIPSIRVRKPNGSFAKVKLSGGKGSLMLNTNAQHKLFWLVVGSPGASYSITMSTSSGYKVVASRNPIKLKVPNGNSGYGRQAFSIIQA